MDIRTVDTIRSFLYHSRGAKADDRREARVLNHPITRTSWADGNEHPGDADDLVDKAGKNGWNWYAKLYFECASSPPSMPSPKASRW